MNWRMIALAATLLFAAMAAHAACTSTTYYTPDGRQVVCTSCTDMNGQVTVTCY